MWNLLLVKDVCSKMESQGLAFFNNFLSPTQTTQRFPLNKKKNDYNYNSFSLYLKLHSINSRSFFPHILTSLKQGCILSNNCWLPGSNNTIVVSVCVCTAFVPAVLILTLQLTYVQCSDSPIELSFKVSLNILLWLTE